MADRMFPTAEPLIKTQGGVALAPEELDAFTLKAEAAATAKGHHFKTMFFIMVCDEGSELAIVGCDCPGCQQRAMMTLAKLMADHVTTPH